MRIYKVGAHEAREMSFGEMIAEAKATLPASVGEETSGGLYFTFTEVDEEYGLVSEITPEIDDEIYVVLSGYDNDAIQRFAVPLCADVWDEGIGETGYNIQLDDEGNIGTARSLNAMFNGFKGYSAPGLDAGSSSVNSPFSSVVITVSTMFSPRVWCLSDICVARATRLRHAPASGATSGSRRVLRPSKKKNFNNLTPTPPSRNPKPRPNNLHRAIP